MTANELNILFRIDDRQVLEKERTIRQTLRSLMEQDKQFAALEKGLQQELITAEKQKADKIKQISQQEARDRTQVIESLKRSLKQQQDDYIASEKQKADKIKQINQQEADEKKRIRKQEADEKRRQDRQDIADNKMIHDSQQRMYERLFGGQTDAKTGSGGVGAGLLAGITVAIGLAMMGINGLISKMRELFTVAKEGAEFGVLKDNFETLSGGTEKARFNIELLRSAVAGNLDDKALMDTANKYKFLGLTIEDTARLMDGLETRSDAMKVTFEAGQKAFDSYVMTGRDKSLRVLGINAGEVKTKFEELVRATGKSVEELDAEEVQALRTKVVFDLLGVAGKNVNDILNKPLDNADKLASIETGWENIKDSISLAFSQQIVSNIDKQNKSLRDTSFQLKDNESIIKKVFDAYKTWSDYIDSHSPVRILINIGLKFNEVFNDIGKILNKSIGSVDNFFTALKQNPNTSWVGPVIDGLKGIYKWAVDVYNKIFDIKNTAPSGDVSPGPKSLDDMVRDAVKSKEKQGLFKFKMNAKSGTSTYEGDTGTGRGGNTEVKEDLDDIQKLQQEIADLELKKNEYAVKYGDTSTIVRNIIDEQLKKQLELNTLLEKSPLRKISMNDSGIIGDEKYQERPYKTAPKTKEQERAEWLERNKDLPFFKEMALQAKILDAALTNLTSGFESFFNVMKSGEGVGTAFKELLKSILISTINFVQGMILAAIAKSFADSVLSFGATLLKELPEIALATAGLEAAKAIIGGLAEGGPVNKSGMYLVGEQGPEIRYLSAGGGVMNNADSVALLNNLATDKRAAGQSIEINNHYHNLIDGMTFKTNTDIKISKKKVS